MISFCSSFFCTETFNSSITSVHHCLGWCFGTKQASATQWRSIYTYIFFFSSSSFTHKGPLIRAWSDLRFHLVQKELIFPLLLAWRSSLAFCIAFVHTPQLSESALTLNLTWAVHTTQPSDCSRESWVFIGAGLFTLCTSLHQEVCTALLHIGL